mmetsp:Transcript_6457/g.9695  ORF Transcript_6457/g.9695 Transcript_6457/m.9695 type:complete len:383 (-) Transcript_6457:159-1307(-)|eukprot:CAMPEP_0171464040 /NCGR_PEP_ID=MMETSP0945-20130129/7485_1 /TAXON_ID=109269 /ORGANISM="Vaucheria litorea, Strain CCMP2940" /LENGTH=382 /DNA_ID=CAMNT_0011990983 /DNA_START=95 /DNA_END=1243 /DNA_ORIENTATION=+
MFGKILVSLLTLRVYGFVPSYYSKRQVDTFRASVQSNPSQSKAENLAEEMSSILLNGFSQTAEKMWDAVDRRINQYNEQDIPSTFDKFGKQIMSFEDSLLKKLSSSPTAAYLNSLSKVGKNILFLPATVSKVQQTELQKKTVLDNESEMIEIEEIEEKKNVGTVLKRSAEVQNVLDALQLQAVQSYKNKKLSNEKINRLKHDAEFYEAKLENLLMNAKMNLQFLNYSEKNEMVGLLEALERSFDTEAFRVENPVLRGEWSLVYSNSAQIFKAILGKRRSLFFKITDPVQTIDPTNHTIINSATIRLRWTPFKFRIKQQGIYKRTICENEPWKVLTRVNFDRAGFNRFFRPFKKCSADVNVTFVGEKWRICRCDDVMVTFRKV